MRSAGPGGPSTVPAADGPRSLDPAELFGLAPSGLLQAARDYVQLGRVHDPRQRGRTLAAEVDGGDDIYTARVTFAAAEEGATPVVGVVPACTCPSQRPYCKHVLALLWLWAEQPSSFEPIGAWEAVLSGLPAAESAAVLASAAMGQAPALALLRAAACGQDWAAAPPGRCLEAWPAFCATARQRGDWPAAALELGRRIAGTPGSQPEAGHLGLATRQLAWWLTLVAPHLPAPALTPWLRHLRALIAGAAAPPPEVAVWLARLAAILPEPLAADACWLARFAADTPSLASVFEAELQRQMWEREVTWRLTGGGPEGAPPAAALDRLREVARAFRGEVAEG